MPEVHRVVETIMGEIEIVTSNFARLTDALCFMFFSITVITVALGVLWASKLYSQTLQERAKIKGKHYFIFSPVNDMVIFHILQLRKMIHKFTSQFNRVSSRPGLQI